MKKSTTFLSTIACIAIVWYLFTSFNVINNWWSLPLIAGITAVSTVILPLLANRFKPIFSIISTGLVVFLLKSLDVIITFDLIPLASVLFGIAIFTEIYTRGVFSLKIGDYIFDVIVCLFIAWVLLKITNPIMYLGILLLCFIIILVIDFNLSFSFKRYHSIDDNETDDEIDE